MEKNQTAFQREAITADSPLSELSVGELTALIRRTVRDCLPPELRADAPQEVEDDGRPVKVYGIKGIMDILNCSHPTAVKYKTTILGPAVMQQGRFIETDVKLALRLYENYKKGRTAPCRDRQSA